MNSRFCSKTWWQMFLLVSVRHVGAHPNGHHHAVFMQISINLGKTFLRISSIWNIALTWILARVFAYLPPFIFQILDLIIERFWFLFRSILSDVRLKTSNRVVPLFSCGGVYPKLRTSYLSSSAPPFASITPNICVINHAWYRPISFFEFLWRERERERADVYTNAKKTRPISSHLDWILSLADKVLICNFRNDKKTMPSQLSQRLLELLLGTWQKLVNSWPVRPH